jgi:hypothetical protein
MSRSTIALAALVSVGAVVPSRALAAEPENMLGSCKDGIDNDGDGFLDCADQDCGIFAMCATPSGSAGTAGPKGPYTSYATTKGGFGVEISTPVPVTPFFELRYIGGLGGNTDKDSEVEHDMIILSSFSIVLAGLRFL